MDIVDFTKFIGCICNNNNKKALDQIELVSLLRMPHLRKFIGSLKCLIEGVD